MALVSTKRAMPILDRIFDAPTTAKDAGASSVDMNLLQRDGLVCPTKERVRTGQRGRPAHVYRLTDKARKRVKRVRASA